MRKDSGTFRFLIAFIAILFLTGAQAFAIEKDRPASESVRVIIRLADAPLASYKDTIPGLQGVRQSRTASGHIDINTDASKAYVNYLKQKQDTFIANLRSSIAAQVHWRYQIGFNGVAAKISRNDVGAIRKMPGVVSVSETLPIEFELDESPNLIDLATLWAALPPGPVGAGEGRRIALIDSGVNANHPFFDDTNFTAPAGYPKSFRYENGVRTPLDTNLYASNKVIVGNVYIFPGDTNPAFLNPFGAGSDHGTHVGGIAAGNAGTYTYSTGGADFNLNFSGMAPGAYLMSYRITGDTAEMIAAVEDVIADQADAVNLSLGHSRWLTSDSQHDPVKQALEAAADAGVVVCASSGNAGANGDSTITGSWKNSSKIITVANSTHGRNFANPVSIPGNAGFQNRVSQLGGAPTPPVTSTITGEYQIAPGGTGGNAGLLCNPGPFPEMSGKICLASRGVCSFAEKKDNCQNNGGIAMIVHQNSGEAPIVMGMAGTVTIPAVMITQGDGQAMVSWQSGNPGAQASIDPVTRLTSGWPDVMAASSSKGPSAIMGIKPDVSAIGTNVLSSIVNANGDAVAPFFEQFSGTSMSTPHITGLSALTKALHPTWTPAQIKSAVMNTANTSMFLDVASVQPALAKHRGGGRVQADRLVDPMLTFDPPSVSFGLVQSGSASSKTIIATDMRTSGSAVTYNVTVNGVVTNAAVNVSLSSSSFTLSPGQSASFNVNLGTAGAPAGDFEGFIHVEDSGVSQTFNVPYFVRVQDPSLIKDVLLIDWDRNFGGFDYRAAFESALGSLGLTFDTFNGGLSNAANGNAGPSYALLQNYGTVIMFMGDAFTQWSATHTGGSFPLEDYVTNGGKLILIAQDFNSQVAYSQNTGSDFTLSSMAGWIQTDFDFYPVDTFAEVLVTQFELFGETGDVSANNGGDGANNQFFPDAGRKVVAADRDDPNINLYNAENIAPHARVLGNYTVTTFDGEPIELSSNAVSTGVAPDLTLENEVERVNWAAAIIHVGTEGLNTNLGADLTMVDAIGNLYNFVHDSVSVSLSAAGSAYVRDFTADASSALGTEIVSYRWDFGDGSGIVETTENTIQHTFAGNGAYHVRVQATNALTRSSVASEDVIISCPEITLDPETLPDAAVNTPYSETIDAVGGVNPYTFAVTAGTLPTGITLASDGTLSGTPTVGGVFNFDVTATDQNDCTGTRSYTLNVLCPAITLDPTTLPDGDIFQAYSQTITATGGNGPYTFAVSSGSLPAGLSLSMDGELTGTPTESGDFTFDVTATDSFGCTGTQSYTLHINSCAAITIDPATLPEGTQDSSYSQTLTASGGTAPYTFAVTSGTLPAGLTLSASGDLTGTPTATGTFNFDVTATDDLGCTGSISYALTINSPASLFSDDFEDSILDPNWVYTQTWTETGGSLNANPSKKAEAILPPSFAGCNGCTINTSVSTTGGGSTSRIWIYGWRTNKNNQVELMFKPSSGKVILRQVVNGSIAKKVNANFTLVPNTVYNVSISFNGTQLEVLIDGNSVLTMVPVGTLPTGTAGFGVKATGASFGFITID